MNEKNKKVTLNPKFLQFGKFALLFILFITSLALIAQSYIPAGDNSQVLMTYNVNNKVNYKVNLKENNFYEEKYLGMNKRYVASLIDTIDVDFIHTLSGSKKMDMTYSYTISAYISSVFNDSNDHTEIWRKNYSIAKPVTKTVDNINNYTINETISIDYQQYNAIANDYKSTLSLPVESYLYVVLNVNSNGSAEATEKRINENNKLEIKIPLSVSTLAIETNYKGSQLGSISSENSSTWSINFITLIIGVVLLILTIIPAYKSYDKFRKLAKQSEFKIKLNRMLKDYEEVIAEVAELPNLNAYQLIDIKVFRDMIDIQAELHVPILYYALKEGNGGVFFITHENKAYRYYIKEDGINSQNM